ncbi:hypothetical protein METH109765_07270 [Mesobacillus thioparans]
MVTPVQKHFRKEMQKLNQTGNKFGAENRQRNKRPWWDL